MKHRDLITTAGGAVAGFFLGVVVAATPCPPPQVSVAGGTSTNTTCPTGGGTSYTTNFPGTENPISEGGKWLTGGTVGIDWNNPRTVAGEAFGAAIATTYNDDIAVLTTSFTPNQYAQGTVYRAPGYSPGVSHEVELLLHFQISANVAHGYEVLWGISGYIAIVRWEGPVGIYTALLENVNPGIGAPVDGDVFRAEIRGGVITVFKNGQLVATGPLDSTWQAGQPGIGFWPTPGATQQGFGWKNYTAGSL